MYVNENRSRPAAGIPGIHHVTLAGSDDGLRSLSVWRQSVDPGGATPPHRHDCEEVVLIESGHGELHIGGAVHRFGPDTTLVIPANADHQIFNTGTTPLRTIGIFASSPVAVALPDGTPLELPWRS
jgi:mannose-6-phosphate isomerase-like protein (cupin superfamily)